MKQGSTVFTSDLHLGPDNHQRKRLADSFFACALQQRCSVYILGDLFDFWANNRALIHAFAGLFHTLQAISSSGGTVGFVFGNRDFLMRPATLLRFGIRHLGEEAVITLDGNKICISHGHMLCLNDTHFLSYRAGKWPLFRFLDLVLPGSVENYIAKKFILKSKAVIKRQDQSRFDFTMDEIDRRLTSGADIVICGHRHESITDVRENGSFYALPAWSDHEAPYLLYENGCFERKIFTVGSGLDPKQPGKTGAC